jgi:hypothetical protein
MMVMSCDKGPGRSVERRVGIITLFQNGKVPPENFHTYTQLVMSCDKGPREMSAEKGWQGIIILDQNGKILPFFFTLTQGWQ